jgi:hypothetical protein
VAARPSDLCFTPELLTRPRPGPLDVVADLGHFALVTWAVDPARVRPHVHPRTVGRCVRARVGLYDRLGVVPLAEQDRPHSVLLQHRTDFTVYLPPGRWRG